MLTSLLPRKPEAQIFPIPLIPPLTDRGVKMFLDWAPGGFEGRAHHNGRGALELAPDGSKIPTSPAGPAASTIATSSAATAGPRHALGARGEAAEGAGLTRRAAQEAAAREAAQEAARRGLERERQRVWTQLRELDHLEEYRAQKIDPRKVHPTPHLITWRSHLSAF